MRWLALGVLSLALAACNDSTGSPADAATHMDSSSQKDGPQQADAAHPDAPKMDASATCTGMLYDSCNPASSNCMGATTCKTFNGAGFSVCTQTCDAANPCPDQGGQAVQCNGMGMCKPNAPNADCTSP